MSLIRHSSCILFALLTLTVQPTRGQWSPTDCPAACICHQTINNILRSKVNTVDCAERDITSLDNVPENSEALVLRGNQLRVDTLHRQNLSTVLYIDLSSNQLKLHQVDALQALLTRLRSLRALDISNNYLETLQNGLFNGLKSLEFLSLSGNSIVYIERNTFQSLTSLKTLKLENNHLRSINENWFSNVSQSMRFLDISSNKMESIQGSDFIHLVHLERLHLSRNNLSYLHPDSFLDSEIQELHLNDNRLTNIPNDVFLSMTKLTILKLDGNPIVILGKDAVSHHPNLKHVAMTNMPHLRVVLQSAFRNLPKLMKVDLYQNAKLKYVHPKAFVDCTDIRFLHLHSAALRGLDETIRNSLPSLQELSLYNNNIHCSCLAAWLRNSTLDLIDGDKIVCDSPHAVKMATLFQLTASQLNTECSPLVLLESSQSITADFGTDANLECHALGSRSLEWIRPKMPVHSKSNESITPSNGMLRIPMIQHKDEGLYTCLATSAAGASDSASVYIRVIHPVIMLSTLAISKSFIVLEWDETSGSTVISYAAANNGTREINIPSGINQCTIEKLHSDTSYVICLLYHHRMEHSCITVHLLPEIRSDVVKGDNYHNKVSNSGLSTTAKTVLAAMVTFSTLVLLVSIAIVVCKKCHRNKHTKILYSRQENDGGLTENSVHVKLDQCYNPTTAPLCDNEYI